MKITSFKILGAATVATVLFGGMTYLGALNGSRASVPEAEGAAVDYFLKIRPVAI